MIKIVLVVVVVDGMSNPITTIYKHKINFFVVVVLLN